MKRRSMKYSGGFASEGYAIGPTAQTVEGDINHHDGGRGVYFEDPSGHLMEIITRPYGSGGWNP
jgi:catechol 2,3-dioxygenase-like lactoylglutathione lyase family enzyme